MNPRRRRHNRLARKRRRIEATVSRIVTRGAILQALRWLGLPDGYWPVQFTELEPFK